MAFIVYCVLWAFNFLTARLLYDRNPEMSPYQMIAMRSLFAIIFQAMYVNKELKAAVWDGVNRHNSGALVARTVLGVAINSINYGLARYLPLSYLAIAVNMGPFVTLVLAYFMLHERITAFDVTMITMTVAGILVVITQREDETGDDRQQPQLSHMGKIFLYIGLVVMPVCSAGGNIAMRKMQKFHDAVVSWYLSWSLLIFSLLVVLVTGMGFGPIYEWDSTSWALAMGCGLFAFTS